MLSVDRYCDKFIGDFALHGVRSIDMKALEKELHMSVKVRTVLLKLLDKLFLISLHFLKMCNAAKQPQPCSVPDNC